MMQILSLVLVLTALGLVITGGSLVLFTDKKGRALVALLMMAAAWLLACEVAYGLPWEEIPEEAGLWKSFYGVLIGLHAGSTVVLWIICLILLVGLVFSLIPAFKVSVTEGVEVAEGGFQWREAVLLGISLIGLFALSMGLMNRDRNPDLVELAKVAKKSGMIAKAFPFEIHFNGKMYDKNPVEKDQLVKELQAAYLLNFNNDPMAGKLVVEKIHSLSYFSDNGSKTLTSQVVVFSGKVQESPDATAEAIPIERGSFSFPLDMDADETSERARKLIGYISQRSSVPQNVPGLLPNAMKGGKGPAVKFIAPPTF